MSEQHQEQPEEQTPVPSESPASDDIDSETGKTYDEAAADLGWANAEAWMGDPEKHIDSKEFLRRGRESMPLMRSNMHRQAERIAELENSIKYQGDLHAGEMKRQKAHYKAQMREAVAEGDTEAFDAAEKAHDAVPDAPTAPAPSGVSPAEEAFAERNPWYNVDDAKTGAAIIESARLMKEVPNLTQAQHDAQIERYIAKEFNSATPGKKPGSPVGAPRRPGAAKGGKTFANLPDDAKAAFDKFVKTKVFTNDDEGRNRYLAAYKWDD